MKKISYFVNKIFDKYPVVIIALIIYIYYLLTSLNLFENYKEKKTFIDYLMQFDSLIFLWLAAAAYLQLKKIKTEHLNETVKRLEIEKQLEIQKIHAKVVSEITALLQDTVNNPLAVISLTTREIRRKFEADSEIISWLDRIDSAMKKIHKTITDIQLYETQKLIENTNPNYNEIDKTKIE